MLRQQATCSSGSFQSDRPVKSEETQIGSFSLMTKDPFLRSSTRSRSNHERGVIDERREPQMVKA